MEIISKESIKPSSPTPDHLRTFRLSLFDQIFPPNSPAIKFMIYYKHDSTESESLNIKQAEISPLLKRSLSDALALYYPLAGRMEGDIINCGDQGVDFFEAQVDACLPNIIESARVEDFIEFAPSGLSGGAVLGIQLNRFNCGGICIGISLNHRMGDACTLSMFLKSWAAMARGGDTHTVQAPSFVVSTLFPPNEGQGQRTLKIPKYCVGHTRTRRFRFSSSKIAALRAAVDTSAVVQVVKPSRVELVTAAIWKFMARKGRGQHGSLKSMHWVNIRRRMDPPLSENVFGNLVQTAEASGNGEMEMGELVSKMREAIGKMDSESLRELQGENGYGIVSGAMEKLWEMKVGDFAMFNSWCNFPFYNTDFGWGKPVWVSVGFRPNAYCTLLVDSMEDIGGVEAWITMDEDWTWDEFEKEVARHDTQCLDV